MSGLVLKATDESLIPTPPTDKATVFLDQATNEPSYKDDSGAVSSLKGAAGAAGQGVPIGGAAGQVLAKIDGTDYNTQWVANPRTPNVQTVASSATVTPTFSNDEVVITAQAAGLTLANPSGTAVDGWGMVIRIKDDGTARSIAYGTQYRAIGVALPTTTVISKVLYLAGIWNNTESTFDILAVAQQA